MQLFQEKYWAIDYGFTKRIEPMLMNGKLQITPRLPLAEFTSNKASSVLTGLTNAKYFGGGAFIINGVVVMPVIGSTTTHGDNCTLAYSDLEYVIALMENNPEAKGMVMRMDTPGGAVTGLNRLSKIIKNSSKPIGYSVEGLCCSAGMYQAAFGDFVFVEEANTTTLGSIGVLQILVDQSAALEKQGLKVTIQRGPKSNNKALGNSIEGYSEEFFAEETKILGKIEADFHKVMKAGRPNISEQIWTDEAKTYTGAEAIKLGLADAVATLEESIQYVSNMNGKRKKYSKPVKYGF